MELPQFGCSSKKAEIGQCDAENTFGEQFVGAKKKQNLLPIN